MWWYVIETAARHVAEVAIPVVIEVVKFIVGA